MGLSKLNALQKEKFGDSDQGFRKVSYKVQFFRMLHVLSKRIKAELIAK